MYLLYRHYICKKIKTMKRKLLIIATFVANTLVAQQSYYFGQYQEAYEPLTDSISLNQGQIWDDPTYSVPIGFNFDFFGHTFTAVEFEDFYSGLGGELGFIAGGSDTMYHFSTVGADIIDRGDNDTTSLSPISYKLEGLSGNHIFKLEYNNVGFYNEDEFDYSSFINYQVWLYEGSNKIEIHFGESFMLDSVDIFEDYANMDTIGFIFGFMEYNDASSDLLNGHYIQGVGPLANLIYEDTATYTIGSGLEYPISGTVYQWALTQTASIKSIESSALDFNIYPNPVNDNLSIQVKGGAKVHLYNIAGNIISTYQVTNSKTINVSQLNQGIYFIKIESTNGQVGVKRFVKK